MKHVLSHTEKTIATAKIPTNCMESLYKEFISNNVSDHDMDSSLKALLPTIVNPAKNQITVKNKRKRNGK